MIGLYGNLFDVFVFVSQLFEGFVDFHRRRDGFGSLEQHFRLLREAFPPFSDRRTNLPPKGTGGPPIGKKGVGFYSTRTASPRRAGYPGEG
jgi:hypothetical protein